jgi:hypothetical protein
MEDHTFVIPAYLESPHLETCIKSLLCQTIKSKIIITTSTPCAYSKNMADRYSIPYFVNVSDVTDVATNWNFALSKTDTKLATIAHQDDEYEPAYAESVINKVQKYKKNDLLIVFTDYKDMIDGIARTFSLNALVKDILLSPFIFSKVIKSVFLKKMVLAFGNPICCPSVTFNMEVLRGFEFPLDYKVDLDWYAWYQLASRPGAFLFVNKKLTRHRLHSGSGTVAVINDGTKNNDDYRMFELIWGSRFAKLIAKIYAISHKDNEL